MCGWIVEVFSMSTKLDVIYFFFRFVLENAQNSWIKPKSLCVSGESK